MTERKLIEAVLDALINYRGCSRQAKVKGILATPSVQTALAEVRGEGACGHEAYTVDSAGQIGNCVDCGESVPATPKPGPVLQWEEDRLWLGEQQVAKVWCGDDYEYWVQFTLLGGSVKRFPTLAKARTAAEQAVRDGLRLGGCV